MEILVFALDYFCIWFYNIGPKWDNKFFTSIKDAAGDCFLKGENLEVVWAEF